MILILIAPRAHIEVLKLGTVWQQCSPKEGQEAIGKCASSVVVDTPYVDDTCTVRWSTMTSVCVEWCIRDKVSCAIDGLAGDLGTPRPFRAQNIINHTLVTRNLAIYTIRFWVCFNMIKISMVIPRFKASGSWYHQYQTLTETSLIYPAVTESHGDPGLWFYRTSPFTLSIRS